MKARRRPAHLQRRYREWTLALYLLAVAIALVGFVRMLSLSVPAFGIAFGTMAVAFGLVFGIRATVAFVFNDEDFGEAWSFISALMFMCWTVIAPNYFGLGAAVLVTAAWTLGRSGDREEQRIQLEEARTRRKALGSKADPMRGMELIEESHIDLADRNRRRQEEDPANEHPATRQGALDRARMIDGNPWQLPPEGNP